uniref:Uncharacterized protein n=1 Tax=Cacopsylla melanoneura TaxID=428564 RepID=A0A8D8RV38_9HEMI
MQKKLCGKKKTKVKESLVRITNPSLEEYSVESLSDYTMLICNKSRTKKKVTKYEETDGTDDVLGISNTSLDMVCASDEQNRWNWIGSCYLPIFCLDHTY